MEDHIIERLSRQLRAGVHRRSLAGLGALGLASWVMTPTDTEARKKKKKKKKKKKTPGTPPPTTPKPRGCSPACGSGTTCINGACVSTTNLQAAINAAAPGETVTLPPETWSLSGTLTVDRDLTLRGSGIGQTILDGNHSVPVMTVKSGATVTLEDLTIANGRDPDPNLSTSRAGGILNKGTLSLRDVEVTGCKAVETGGIYNEGTLDLYDGTRVHENQGTADNSSGGGIHTHEGAVTTLHSGSEVRNNSAGYGGGINVWKGELLLKSGSRVSGNTADMGGGIYVNYDSTITMQDGSLVGGDAPEDANTALSYGGGLLNRAATTLESGSRITGNQANQGGGCFNDYFQGTLTLKAGSRVSGNTATAGGGIWNDAGLTTVESGALVCGNTPANDQCHLWSGSFSGSCPNPGTGICPS